MRDRQRERRDAGGEVLFGQFGELGAAGLIGGQRRALDLAPALGRNLGLEVSEFVRQAALPKRSREHLLERPDQARRAVGHAQNRVGEPARLEVSQESRGSLPCSP
jgi:hypothetical protein